MAESTAAVHAVTIRRRVAVGFVFLWFLIGGIAHFVSPEAEARVVPPSIPWPHAAVWISGAFELVGAAGLLWGTTRRAAGIGVFVLTILFTPVHVYMLQRANLFDVPYWALVLRLPLLAVIAWGTFRRSAVLPRTVDRCTDVAARPWPTAVSVLQRYAAATDCTFVPHPQPSSRNDMNHRKPSRRSS